MARGRKKPNDGDEEDDAVLPEQAGSKGEAPGEHGGPGHGAEEPEVEHERIDRDAADRAADSSLEGDPNNPAPQKVAMDAADTGPRKTLETESGASDFDRAMSEAKTRKADSNGKTGEVTGTLYSADENTITLMTDDKQAGRSFEVTGAGCEVWMIDVETTLDDLKRGDRVKLYGNPVTKVEAVR